MIRVRLERAKTGEFVSCEAKGHAGFDVRGSDIVCSAVTVLLRTAAEVLSKTGGINVAFEAEERGSMRFCLDGKDGVANASDFFVENPEISAVTRASLVCAADFLEYGISSVAREYPDNVELDIVIL